MPTEKKKNNAARIFSSILFIVFMFLCCWAAKKLYDSWRIQRTGEQLYEMRFAAAGEDWSKGMLDVNEDYVGWLTVYGTQISGPVVQGEDNDEYMRKDIFGNDCVGGTLFMDENVDTSLNRNKIIYGHLMIDGSMFGDLRKYKNPDFFAENDIVRYEDQFGEHYYRLFSSMLISGSMTNLRYVNLPQWANDINEQETQLMREVLKERSYIFQDKPFKDDGNYIFLVTCDYTKKNYRLVLVGEEIG